MGTRILNILGFPACRCHFSLQHECSRCRYSRFASGKPTELSGGHLCSRPRPPNTAGGSPCRRRRCTCQTSSEATPKRSRWLPHRFCLQHFPALQYENNSVTACYSPETFPARSCCLERCHGNPKPQIQTKIRSPISTTNKSESVQK